MTQMSVFEQIAKQQQSRMSTNTNERPKRVYPMLRSKDVVQASKNGVFYRVLPLGDRWAFTSYHQIFVTVETDKGSTFTLPLNFPDMSMFPTDENGKHPTMPAIWGGADYDTANDELYNTLMTIVNYNQSMINNGQSKSDVIRLTNNGKIAHTNMSTIREIVTIPETYNAQTQQLVPLEMSATDPNMPKFGNIILTYSTYKSLYMDDMNGQQYLAEPSKQPFTGPLFFIRDDYNMPIYFKEAGGNGYSVEVKETLGRPEGLPQNYLETDEQGLFKHFDDPYRFNAPLEDGDFRNNIVLPYIKNLASQISGTTVNGFNTNNNQSQPQPQPTMPTFDSNPYAGMSQAPQSQPQQEPQPTMSQGNQPSFNQTNANQGMQPQSQQPSFNQASANAESINPAEFVPEQSQPQSQPTTTTATPSFNAQPQPQPTTQTTAPDFSSPIAPEGNVTPVDKDKLAQIIGTVNKSVDQANNIANGNN